MKSLGCNYIQGYLYSKPLEEKAFIEKIGQIEHEAMSPAMEFIKTVDAGKFWDPTSMETLIFSNLVGAAAIFTYRNGEMETLRFFTPEEIDIEMISPPIRPVLRRYLEQYT